MKKSVFLVILLVLLTSCNRKKNQPGTRGDGIVYVEDYSMYDIGTPQTIIYEGLLPSAGGFGTRYTLTITKNEFEPEGKYILITTQTSAKQGDDVTLTSRGYLHTLRGSADDENATVYKLIDEIDDNFRYLLVQGEYRLRLLTEEMKDSSEGNPTDYEIVRVR